MNKKINFNKQIKEIALKSFWKANWKRITAFLIGYILAIIDKTFLTQFKIILLNLTIVNNTVFWGSYLATVIFTYFLLRIYLKLFSRSSLDVEQQKTFWSKALSLYIVFCMGFFVGVIVDLLVAYVNIAFQVYLQ